MTQTRKITDTQHIEISDGYGTALIDFEKEPEPFFNEKYENNNVLWFTERKSILIDSFVHKNLNFHPNLVSRLLKVLFSHYLKPS